VSLPNLSRNSSTSPYASSSSRLIRPCGNTTGTAQTGMFRLQTRLRHCSDMHASFSTAQKSSPYYQLQETGVIYGSQLGPGSEQSLGGDNVLKCSCLQSQQLDRLACQCLCMQYPQVHH
jgi:hypothetical protein